MRRASVLILLAIFSAALAKPSSAADLTHWRSTNARIYEATPLPFPRSERAQAVWASLACWTDCGRQCAWGQAACLKVDVQATCIFWTDACDRSCQRQCRLMGGPLLPIE